MFNEGTIAAAAQPWTPALLFKKGEQGVWYDPSDIERYMALGEETVTNGGFDTNTAGWTTPTSVASFVSVGGKGRLTTAASATLPQIYQSVSPKAGASYLLSASISGNTTGTTFRVVVYNSTDGVNVGTSAFVSEGVAQLVVSGFAPGKSYSVLVIAAVTVAAGLTVDIDNVSMRELPQLGTATMFQDALGTTPVTAVEQPVGLILDKRFGGARGPELLTNGDFANGLASWVVTGEDATHIVTAAGGTLRYQSGTTTPALALSQPGVLVEGKTYEVTVVVSNYVSGTLKSDSLYGAPIATKAGVNKTIAVSKATSFNILRVGDNVDITIDSISVREVPGNHASQVTTTARPILSARRNLLLQTNNLMDASWSAVAATRQVHESGVKLTFTGSNAYLYRSAAGLLPTGWVTLSMVQYDSTSNVGGLYCTAAAGGAKTAIFDFSGQGSVSFVTSGASASITKLDVGKFLVSLTFESSQGAGNIGFYLASSVAGESIVLSSPQVELGTKTTAYQRVNTATDYDTVGFPHYLRFDGVDDYLVTQNIDFTGTDKVASVAGVTNLSDATRAIVFELSSSYANPGTFATQYPSVEGEGTALFASNGTSMAFASAATGKAAFTAVISGRGDIAGDVASARVNGAITATSSADQGAGNYGNYPLYICSRSVYAQKFNGHLYQLGIRGAATNDDLIRAWEKAAAKKTGVNL